MSESKQPDEADRLKAGTLEKDPKTNVRPIGIPVPRVLTVLDMLHASYAQLEKTKTGLTCTTGHYKIDQITGGFRPGFVWLFGADTSFGKSTFLISVTDINLRLGKRVMIVSSEDTEEIYGSRLIVRRAGVSAIGYRDNELDYEERQRVNDVLARAEKTPVFVDARRYPVEDLAPFLRKVIIDENIDLIGFDYVGEFQTKRRFQDERIKYREIASVLRNVVKDTKRAGIIFSQLTVDEKTKIPTRRNIRECRDMANAAEVIAMGFEPDVAVPTKNGEIPPGTKCIYLDKVKNGPRGAKVPMDWNKHTANFEEVRAPYGDERYSD